MTEVLKAILFGIVEGITEWLPISSTGHMILLNEIVHLDVSSTFYEMFEVVIQFGAILAVILLFWKKIFPFDWSMRARREKRVNRKEIWRMWGMILISTLPAVVVGLPFDDLFTALFYNSICVATALIVFGIGFLWIENRNAGRKPRITSIRQIDAKTAVIIGLFQVIAAIFPGTSRSGATILGALLIGVARPVAAEYTFFLAIPVMFGASLLKIVKFGFHFSAMEATILFVGMLSAFFVSVFVIRFFMGYIRKHNFRIFGYYRIVLGILVLLYFAFVG